MGSTPSSLMERWGMAPQGNLGCCTGQGLKWTILQDRPRPTRWGGLAKLTVTVTPRTEQADSECCVHSIPFSEKHPFPSPFEGRVAVTDSARAVLWDRSFTLAHVACLRWAGHDPSLGAQDEGEAPAWGSPPRSRGRGACQSLTRALRLRSGGGLCHCAQFTSQSCPLLSTGREIQPSRREGTRGRCPAILCVGPSLSRATSPGEIRDKRRGDDMGKVGLSRRVVIS